MFAGIRGPGKYDGVVFFDRWDTCILFSSVYVMYISEYAKEALRPYAGQSVEIDAEKVSQSDNPGDGLIRKFRIVGPAVEKDPVVKVTGLALKAEATSPADGRDIVITMTIHNETDHPIDVVGAELGFAVFTPRFRKGKYAELEPSDGDSMALITRANAERTLGQGAVVFGEIRKEYQFYLDETTRLPDICTLRPHHNVSTTFKFVVPPGEYQFVAGYGGGVHAEKSIISNPISFDVSADHGLTIVH